jgi:hypothetical protein
MVPGAMKPTVPITQALNMLDRYHFLVSMGDGSSWLTARSESPEVDMFGMDKCELM